MREFAHVKNKARFIVAAFVVGLYVVIAATGAGALCFAIFHTLTR